MTIGELLTKTMSDPTLYWTALSFGLQVIQTLMVLVSAILIIPQIIQLRRDATEKRIGGLKTALDALDTNLFRQVSKQAGERIPLQGVNWSSLLDAIKLVALLIKEKYTSEELLFAMKGKELYDISVYIKKNGLPADIQEDLDDRFKPAMKLLERVFQQGKKLGFTD